MGSGISKDVPNVRYLWTYRAKNFFNDTTPIVSGDGSTVALYSRGEKKIHVLDGQGSTITSIKCKQKMTGGNVSAIPSLSYDGSRIVTRDSNSVILYDRQGNLLWEYERQDKIVRSGSESWIAQISANGKVVVVRMFHEMIVLDGDTGSVVMIAHHRGQMANSIPRISDDGSTIVVCDRTTLMGYINGALAWTVESPVKNNLVGGNWWGDPALSGDGSTCAVVGKSDLYIFNAQTGAQIGQIPGLRHRNQENSNEAAFSQDGKIVAVVRKDHGLSVFTGQGYTKCLLDYVHDSPHRPVAPLLTRDGKCLASKAGNGIMVWSADDKGFFQQTEPMAAARVEDDSGIPGGPTVHSKDYHHDRDTHHKRTFTASYDGSLCVAVAKRKELWAFSLPQYRAPQGGAFRT